MLTPSTLPQAGDEVTYQGETYTVRAVDGNVLELAYHTGGFFRLVHASSVTVCPSPATNTAASLPAPAAGQGEGTHSDLLRGELIHPLGFWVVCCDACLTLYAFAPTSRERAERRL